MSDETYEALRVIRRGFEVRGGYDLPGYVIDAIDRALVREWIRRNER